MQTCKDFKPEDMSQGPLMFPTKKKLVDHFLDYYFQFIWTV